MPPSSSAAVFFWRNFSGIFSERRATLRNINFVFLSLDFIGENSSRRFTFEPRCLPFVFQLSVISSFFFPFFFTRSRSSFVIVIVIISSRVIYSRWINVTTDISYYFLMGCVIARRVTRFTFALSTSMCTFFFFSSRVINRNDVK